MPARPRRRLSRGGVNDQGLAVVLASASAIPHKVRAELPYRSGMREILANCATVDEALQRQEFLTGPKFLMLADRQLRLRKLSSHGVRFQWPAGLWR